MIDGRITTLDFTENLKAMSEFHIEVPPNIKSAGAVIVDCSLNYMRGMDEHGLKTDFLMEFITAIRKIENKDLVVVVNYTKGYFTLFRNLVGTLGYYSLSPKPYINDFTLFISNRVPGLEINNVSDLALRSNFNAITLAKLYSDKKDVVGLVNEYLNYLDGEIPKIKKKTSVDTAKLLSELADIISYYRPDGHYQKCSFTEWYVRTLGKEI